MVFRPRRRLLAPLTASVALLGALVLGACNAPSLPLPPPAALVSAPDPVTGQVTIDAQVLSNAYILCLNDRTDRGVIERADDMGHSVFTINDAIVGDSVSIWQQVGSDLSPPRQFFVPAPR